jgi:hypothetical protein
MAVRVRGPLPLIALAAVLVMPSLRGVSVSEDESRLPVVESLVLMVGAGSLLAGLTDLSVWSIPLVAVGAAVTIPALRRIVPAGTLTARRGVPATSAAAFLASAAFFAIDGFVPAEVEEGREAGELSSTILMDYLGVGIGAGLGGASVALAGAGTISIEAGLAGAVRSGSGSSPRCCSSWSLGVSRIRTSRGGSRRYLRRAVQARPFRPISCRWNCLRHHRCRWIRSSPLPRSRRRSKAERPWPAPNRYSRRASLGWLCLLACQPSPVSCVEVIGKSNASRN